MKKITPLLSGISILGLALTLLSCNKCKDVECLNGGDCNKDDGKCICLTGYEGTDCGTEEREKFIAIYSASASCSISGSSNYTATISKSTGNVTEVKLSGAWGIFSNTVKATVDGTDITIPDQEPDNDGYRISGSGSISANQNIVSVTYTITDPQSATDNCSATWTKQ